MDEVCDPEQVYDDYNSSDFEIEIAKWVNLPLTMFIIVSSPFLIIMPFVSNRLNSNCRKMIAMIVLSDLMGAIATVVMSFSKSEFRQKKHTKICYAVTLAGDVTLIWSMTWSLILLIYVLSTLRPRCAMDKRRFMVSSHAFAWTYGIAIMLITIDWHEPITYSNDYLTHNGCQANMTFLYTKNKKKCLISGERAQMYQFFYGQFFALQLFSVIVFGIIIYVAYNSYRENMANKEALPENVQSTGLNSLSYSNNNLDVAANQSYVVFKSTFRFAITSFAYLILCMPIVWGQLYQANHGPFLNEHVRVTYGVCFSIIDTLVAIINITFYGLLSPIFRKEFKDMVLRVTRRTYRQVFVCLCCNYSNRDLVELPEQRIPREPVFGMSTSLQIDNVN